MGDLRQSVFYKNHLENLGWRVDNAAGTHVFVKKFPVIGSFAKIQRPHEVDFEAIGYSVKTRKAVQVIIEPKNREQEEKVKKQGFKQSKSPYLPSKTLHIDLTKSVDYLYSKLKKDTRYSLRKTKNVKVYRIGNMGKFRKSFKDAVGFKRFAPSRSELASLKKTFGDNALFLVTPGGESGAVFLHAENTSYYWLAFSNETGRRGHYQYKIVWSGITWAREKGAKIFDFEGIYDERFPNKRWKGFTHFKRSFGGNEVKFPGAYTKFLLPFKK